MSTFVNKLSLKHLIPESNLFMWILIYALLLFSPDRIYTRWMFRKWIEWIE